jgi:shikimate kinase
LAACRDEVMSSRSNLQPAGGAIDRIVLTGFMGAGKSTVGLLLAERMGWDSLDLDTYIETTTKKSARALFDALGETEFRQLESDLWSSVLQRSHAIVAPGGAVIDKAENQNVLAASEGSFVVFLDAPFQTLIDRCLRQEQREGGTYRPLLHKTETAHARYMERRVLYANHAHRVVDVAHSSPEFVAQDIWQKVFAMC